MYITTLIGSWRFYTGNEIYNFMLQDWTKMASESWWVNFQFQILQTNSYFTKLVILKNCHYIMIYQENKEEAFFIPILSKKLQWDQKKPQHMNIVHDNNN
jgi:hypothetical protein